MLNSVTSPCSWKNDDDSASNPRRTTRQSSKGQQGSNVNGNGEADASEDGHKGMPQSKGKGRAKA